MFLKLTNLTLWGYGLQSPLKVNCKDSFKCSPLLTNVVGRIAQYEIRNAWGLILILFYNNTKILDIYDVKEFLLKIQIHINIGQHQCEVKNGRNETADVYI